MTAIGNGVARLMTVVALIIGVHLAAESLTPDGLGLWLLFVTAGTVVGFADLGIGNGMLNVIAEADGHDDPLLAREAISSAFVLLTGLAAVLALFFLAAYRFVDWAALFNVTDASATEVGPSVAAFVIVTLVSLPLGIAQRVHIAYQEGWLAALWIAVGSIISIVGVTIASLVGASLTAFVAFMLAGPGVAYLLNTIALFGFSHPNLRPRLDLVSATVGRRILGSGFMFFALGATVALAYQSDAIVISHYLGSSFVTQYAVTFRLLMLFPIIITLFLVPLWPAYGEAVARGDSTWVLTTLKRSIWWTLWPTALATVLLLPLIRPIITIWVGPEVDPPISLLLGTAVWAVLYVVSTALGVFLNGTGVLRLQVAMALPMGIANVALSIVLVNQIGVAGPIWATVITQTLCVLVPLWFVMRELMRSDPSPSVLTSWIERWADRKSRA